MHINSVQCTYVPVLCVWVQTCVKLVLVDHSRQGPRHELGFVARAFVEEGAARFDLRAQTLRGVGRVGALEAEEESLDDEQVDADELPAGRWNALTGECNEVNRA